MSSRAILVTIVALAVAGLPAFFFVRGDEYGISHDNPLGRFDPLDAMLVERSLVKSDRVHRPDGTVTDFPSHVIGGQYRIRSSAGVDDWVALGARQDGSVFTVSGSFVTTSGDPKVGAQQSIVARFVREFWLRTEGAAPAFSQERRDDDYDEVATGSNPEFVASWQKKRLKSWTVHFVYWKLR